MKYNRVVMGYHGCDARVASRLLRGVKFKASENKYDWLGTGVYFWEYGIDRAYQFALEQKERGKVKTPAVVGAVIQLGTCFDLLDTESTDLLASAYKSWNAKQKASGLPRPSNRGKTADRLFRGLDCAVINWLLETHVEQGNKAFDTVRCCFLEGRPVYPSAGIRKQSHIQIAVRNYAAILGVFKPT